MVTETPGTKTELNEKSDLSPTIKSEDEKLPEKLEQQQASPPVQGEIVGDRHLSVDKHGMKLHPQPTNDPLDPLNWSKTRKHSILAVVMALYFMFTFLTTNTVPSFPELQTQFNASTSQINWTVAIPALGLAVGPLIWSSMADIIGRRIVFIIGTVIALVSTVGAAKATGFSGYMAARFFQGLGVAPASTVGLAIINDMFFEYERGQKVGLWVISIDIGLLFGPLIGGFMDLVSAAWIQWLTAILFAAVLVAEVAFLPETLYPRNRMLSQMDKMGFHDIEEMRRASLSASADAEKATKKSSLSTANPATVKRTKDLPFINILPVPGLSHPAPWEALTRFLYTWPYMAVSIPIFIYCVAWYWWILCVITEVPSAYINYSPQIQGLFFIGLILGTLFAEAACSGTLSDWIVRKLAGKQGGVRTPEMRLWLLYPAAIFTAIGLIVWGVSIEHNYHWIVGQIAFFLLAAGIQTGNTIIASYVVDAYPLQSMSVITFYAVLLNLSAFVSPFFVAPWVAANGFAWCFAAQGILTAFVGGGGLAIWHLFGGRVRGWKGQATMGWRNPEFEVDEGL